MLCKVLLSFQSLFSCLSLLFLFWWIKRQKYFCDRCEVTSPNLEFWKVSLWSCNRQVSFFACLEVQWNQYASQGQRWPPACLLSQDEGLHLKTVCIQIYIYLDGGWWHWFYWEQGKNMKHFLKVQVLICDMVWYELLKDYYPSLIMQTLTLLEVNENTLVNEV